MNFLKNEISGWKKWEVMWLASACFIIISLSIYWKETMVGIISATSGVICVVCTGKGKVSAFFFGIINTILYGYISYQSKFYGEVMLNIMYYLPMQFYGMYAWKQHMSIDTGEVIKRQMTKKSIFKLFGIIILLVLAYGHFLTTIDGNLAYVDALSTIISIVAMIISIRRYAEQWILWIIVNVVTIFMWGYAFIVLGTESIATLLMWCVYLINAIIMYIKWKKEASQNEI